MWLRSSQLGSAFRSTLMGGTIPIHPIALLAIVTALITATMVDAMGAILMAVATITPTMAGAITTPTATMEDEATTIDITKDTKSTIIDPPSNFI